MPRKTTATPARLFAGTSGWAYPTWKPGFYPPQVSTKKFLSFYATQLNSVEVNYTFTKLPTSAIVSDWLAQTPAGFRFSFKAPQRITHFARLRDCEQHLVEFLASIAPVRSAGKLGLVLFQLPPNFKPDPDRLRDFLAVAPFRDGPPLAFEFRHPGWFTTEVFDLLRGSNAALCIAESDVLESPEVHTTSTHTSFRLRHPGGYKARQIAAFAERFALLAKDRDVYVYFKHEDEPTGALNASAFLRAARRSAAL